MADNQGLAIFPGINQILGASYSRTHGISPGICVISIAPQFDFVPLDGDLVFTFGGQVLTFQNCRVDYSTLNVSDSGWVTSLNIMDRRWKWRAFSGGGGVSGFYNIWRDNFSLQDGKVDPNNANTQTNVLNTERTPQELAKLCLEAMGEQDYNVDALPADVRPTVHWDFDNPAEALAALCEDMGCHICLLLDNSVKIVTVGEGADLPTDGIMHPAFSINPPDMPDKIAVVCGPSRYQLDLQLEGIGSDNPIPGLPGDPTLVGLPGKPATVTGTVLKAINSLSYAQNATDTNKLGGFKWGDFPYFTILRGKVDGQGNPIDGLQALAQATVGKQYRVKIPVRFPLMPEETGNFLIRAREQLVLENQQVNVWSINEEQENMPAAVFGVYYPGLVDLNNNQPTLKIAPVLNPGILQAGNLTSQFYRKPFQIDSRRGLVIFDEPVLKNVDPLAADGLKKPAKMTPSPADLVLRCACNIKDFTTGAPKRYIRERDTGDSSGTKTRYLYHDEIVLCLIPAYDSTGYSTVYDAGTDDPRQITSVITNQELVDKECDYYIDAALKEYQSVDAQQVTYGGIRSDIDLDGTIHHVAYSVGAPYAMTTVARNSEVLRLVRNYNEMRRIEKNRQTAEELQRNKNTKRERIMLPAKREPMSFNNIA